MSTFSPVGAGFRTVVRQPGLLLRELAWRWTWGGTALVLVTFTFREYLRSLTVTTTDQLLLSSGQPILVGRAIANIFRGSGERLESALLLVVVACAVLWVVLATLGRGAIAARLQASASRGPGGRAFEGQYPLRIAEAMLKLQTLRAVIFLAFGAAVYGSGLLLAHLLPQSGFGVWAILFVNVFLLLSGAWSFLNWLLSLSTLFANDANTASGAMVRAIDLWRERRGPMVTAGIVFGLLHLVAIVGLNAVLWLPLGFAQLLPARPVLAVMGLIVLLYCAVVDFLLLARLAAYADMAAEGVEPVEASAAPRAG